MAAPLWKSSCVTKGTNTATLEVGKAALNLYLVDAQRQAGHKALFLLVVQPDKRAVILLCHTCGLEHIVAQLLLGVGHIQHKKGQHEKPFVPGLQFVQQLLASSP